MNRDLLVIWDEFSAELEVRRFNGQRITFRATQVLAGGHQMFEVGVTGQNVWVLTGPRGNRRPTRRHFFTQTGQYRGSRAL
jgi:hypothetical protein